MSGQTERHCSEDEYTIFSPFQKGMMTVILGMAMLTSPLTATMYLPLLPALARHFRTTTQAINLTITVYIIFQAISPLVFAGVSDHCGRRPIYLSTLALFTAASLGLSLNTTSYAVLIVLRAAQSFGASSILSVSYGTLADITPPSKRGKFMGPMLAVANLGTCIGPVIDGWIVLASGDFRWAFWTYFIFGSVLFTALIILLPETARNVVGNGSITDRAWNQPLWYLLLKLRSASGDNFSEENNASESRRKFKFSSPLACITIFFFCDTALEIWIQSSYYALWYCIQATIPHTYSGPPYWFNGLQIGLAYLPGAVGVIFGMYLVGRYLDWYFSRTASRLGRIVDRTKDDDLYDFPIEAARTKGCFYAFVFSTGAMIGYGWAIEHDAHVAGPLILQFSLGFLTTWLTQCYGMLLVDIFPKTPSTAATAGTVMRCALSAVVVAILEPLMNNIGKAWLFTLFALLTGFGGIVSNILLSYWGMQWRQRRTKNPRENEVNIVTKKQRTSTA